MTFRTPNSGLAGARTATVRALCFFWLTLPMAAQTVRPILVEHRGQARGRLELVNDTVTPLNVVLETKSFSVSETGEITYRPLDKEIQLKLSAMSFRIPPQQSYLVFYEAKAEKLPAWFVIYADFSGYPVRDKSGLNVQVELPHTVYLLPKQGLQKSEIAIRRAEFRPAEKRVVLDVENTGTSFGRVLYSELHSTHNKAEGSGFPLFPRSHRQIELAWDGKEPPEKLVLRFQQFSVEQKLPRTE